MAEQENTKLDASLHKNPSYMVTRSSDAQGYIYGLETLTRGHTCHLHHFQYHYPPQLWKGETVDDS